MTDLHEMPSYATMLATTRGHETDIWPSNDGSAMIQYKLRSRKSLRSRSIEGSTPQSAQRRAMPYHCLVDRAQDAVAFINI